MARNSRVRFLDNNQGAEVSKITLQPSDIDSDKPFENLFRPSRTEVWLSDHEFTIEYDFKAPVNINSFYLLPKFGELSPLSGAATVTLKANNVDDFVNPALTIVLTGNQEGFLSFFDTEADGFEPHYRYWQVTLDDSDNPNSSIEFSTLYLGDYLTLDLRNVQKGFTLDVVDTSRVFESEGGQRYFDKRLSYKKIDGIALAYITAENRRQIQEWFRLGGITNPTMICLDPTDKVSGGDPFELAIYGQVTKSPTFLHIVSDIYTIKLSVKEFI